MLDKLANDESSSLLRNFVNYGQKKFYNIGPRMVATNSQHEFHDWSQTGR
jgi:hypothetical protein